MKITYETKAIVDKDTLFTMIKQAVESKTGKNLANIEWHLDRAGEVRCTLNFCNETFVLGETK